MQFVFNQSMLFYTWDINKQANTHTHTHTQREKERDFVLIFCIYFTQKPFKHQMEQACDFILL